MKQSDRVLDYIKTHGSITHAEALNEISVACLAERVRDLRNAGIAVKSVKEFGVNQYGEKTHYVRYTL